MRRRRVAGFTLVELLVVIAIIGVLISLLLPALQVAREAARKASCQNNMKQLTLAVITYESTYNVFPPSGIVDYPRRTTDSSSVRNGYVPFESRSGNQFSWIVLVLPNFEQGPLHKQFNFNNTVFKQAPSEPQATPVAALNCPSDNTQGRIFSDTLLTKRAVFAKGNYAAYCSPFHTDEQNFFQGALVGHVPHSRKKFTDGVTNTLMLSEVRTRDHAKDQRGAWALPWTGSTLLAYDAHHLPPNGQAWRDFQNPGTYIVDPETVSTSTQPPNNDGPNFDMLYDCPDATGAVYMGMPCREYGFGTNQYLSAAARSLHTGGVYASYCDGRVTFLNDNIDETQMAYMICINDKKVTSAIKE